MKKQLLIIGMVTLLLTPCLSGCSGPSQVIQARKLSGGPGNSVNMTEQQMKKFPHLKEAILTNKSVETPRDELIELQAILDFLDINIIKYQNEYYEIRFKFGD